MSKGLIRTASFIAALSAVLHSWPAHALIYLPENTLESLLVRADAVVIATVDSTDPAANRASVTPTETFKGQTAGPMVITGMMLQVDSDTRKPRFAKGDRIVAFLGPVNAATSARPLIHAQTLAGDAEAKTMAGCIREILPVAQPLADLANIKKEIDEKALRPIMMQLITSKNGYTQILLGRLMSTRLAERVAPADWEDLIATAIASKRRELALGGLAWAAKWPALPPPIKAAVDNAAAQAESEDVRKAASKLKERG